MDPLLFPVQGRFVVQAMRIQSLKLLFPDAHINRYQENLKVLPLTNYLKSFSSQKILPFGHADEKLDCVMSDML